MIENWADTYEPYGVGFRSPLHSLGDQELAARLIRYKRQVAKRYRVIDPSRAERELPQEQLFLSPKLDGELWFLVKRQDDVALVAYNGRVLHGVRALAGIAERLAAHSNLIVAGELVTTKGDARTRSHQTGTALRDGTLEPTLRFFAFDLVLDDEGEALARPYEARYRTLAELLPAHDSEAGVALVRTERGGPDRVEKRFREWVSEGGAEGLVARSDRGLTYKIKPSKSLDVVVLAYGDRIVDGVHQVRELEVGLLREDGRYQLVGSVGSGFSDADRISWHERLVPLQVPSMFRLANREGTLCRFVRPEIVVEVKVSDLLTTDSWDAPIRRMSLSFDPAEGWKALQEVETAVLLHPVLVRTREDKKVDLASVGLEQLSQHGTEQQEAPQAAVTNPIARVVERAVWTKESKGQLAVRKYVVIETRKDPSTHPPFVVFFTDFSAARKDPLSTSIRTAATREGAQEHVAAWKEENVKKGWSPAGTAESKS